MGASLWIAIGGAIGSVARFWTGIAVARVLGDGFIFSGAFPWGTLLINVVGSFVIGLAAATLPEGPSVAEGNLRLFVIVGVCGGYTTFSAFSLQLLVQLRSGDWGGATANLVLSVVLCVASVAAGYLIGTRLGG